MTEKFSENKINIDSETRVVDGKKYKRVPSGYTLRQYYSHATPEKGPGPGWDSRFGVLKKYGVTEPAQLPDEPHYDWEPIEE